VFAMGYGRQYEEDNEFKARARLHQSKFRVESLQADFKGYGNRLSVEDALRGRNFYLNFDGLFDEVTKRYPPLRYAPVYYDMLRSQHIPFNFFIPFKANYVPELGRQILNHFMAGVIATIEDVSIEYAPKPRERYLDDMTSFDTCIQYRHIDGSLGLIGIEVKYTEREYPYGKKEREEIKNPTSVYNRLTKRTALYKDNCLEILKTAKYKQVWRNQLLGERILEVEPRVKHFTSVILFPRGNAHFLDVCSSYATFLKEDHRFRFVGITFEEFIAAGNRYASEDRERHWLSYLASRYLA
jgi:hypothetical protein